MPATVVLRSDGSVAEILPRSFASADEIAAAVDPQMRSAGVSSTSERSLLTPDAAPAWLKPLVDNAHAVKRAYRRRVPAELLAMVTAANAKAAITGAGRDAAVLVLFSGPLDSSTGVLPDAADLLVTVRASYAAPPRGAGRVSRRCGRSRR